MNQTVLVTGGAGYVGCVLVPKLLNAGYRVKVLDLYLYGANVLDHVKKHPHLTQIKGDIRDQDLLKKELKGVDILIHLACISNDPSYELDPHLGKSINFDAFLPLVRIARDSGVRRFINASSSSVYGCKTEAEVTEDLALEPLTSYSKYKALCEEQLLKEAKPGFTALILRPATVCGYSPRLRLDLTVNILTASAICKKKIKVFGGDQLRPNIHIEDIADLYVKCMAYPDEKIAGRIFNAGYENHSINELARMICRVIGEKDVKIETLANNDERSYRITSKKIREVLGFEPKRSIEDAILDLKRAFDAGWVKDPEDKRYYNIKTMQSVGLK